jgi:hypothetical protein
LQRRLGGFHSWSGRFGDAKHYLPLPRITQYVVQPIACTNSLAQYPVYNSESKTDHYYNDMNNTN